MAEKKQEALLFEKTDCVTFSIQREFLQHEIRLGAIALISILSVLFCQDCR